MNPIYDAALSLGRLLALLTARLGLPLKNSKLRKFAEGQRHILRNIQERFGEKGEKPVIWIHAASLGEYGVARPVIRHLAEKGQHRIVLTFFSPTGYEALKDRHDGIDCVFYLPLDTRRNARAFLDIIQPDKAVFIISEYWLNYLEQLKMRSIPTFLISAVITRRAPFFRWYGAPYRKALRTYRTITVLNEESRSNLESLGFTGAAVTGDPLFDNVAAAAATPYSNPLIERFTASADGGVFIAGSTSDINDTILATTLANRNPDIKFLIVPHEISPEVISSITLRLDGKAVRYSECAPDQDFKGIQTLIVDFVGALAYLYRYARWAYVGGGFTPLLHNVIEATVYGLPVSFGPMIERKTVPGELISLGLGQVVRTPEDIIGWFRPLKDDTELLSSIRTSATAYTAGKCGAAGTIAELLGQ